MNFLMTFDITVVSSGLTSLLSIVGMSMSLKIVVSKVFFVGNVTEKKGPAG